jgi:hypothetical protein
VVVSLLPQCCFDAALPRLQIEMSVCVANATQDDSLAFDSVLRRLEKSKGMLAWEAGIAHVCLLLL